MECAQLSRSFRSPPQSEEGRACRPFEKMNDDDDARDDKQVEEEG